VLDDVRFRLRALFRRRAVDRDLDDELRFHFEQQVDKYVKSGSSREEALRRARLTFGGVDAAKEQCRDAHGIALFDQTVQDLRYAARVLRRNPAFSAVALLSLGLGIGATTAAFSLLDAVVLRPLPVSAPDRLVVLQPQLRGERFVLFNPIYEEMAGRQTVLDAMAAIHDEPHLKVNLPAASPPAYMAGSLVSGSYFRVLGIEPAAGRLLDERDDRPSAGCVAVISHAVWSDRFQRSSAVLRQSLRVHDTPCSIVGVAPERFRGHQGGYASDVWLPLRALTDKELLANHHMAFFSGVIGRLSTGVTAGQAQTSLTTLYQRIESAEPHESRSGRPDEPRRQPAEFTIRLLSGAQ
jgi:MacB-like periplasmic core domain